MANRTADLQDIGSDGDQAEEDHGDVERCGEAGWVSGWYVTRGAFCWARSSLLAVAIPGLPAQRGSSSFHRRERSLSLTLALPHSHSLRLSLSLLDSLSLSRTLALPDSFVLSLTLANARSRGSTASRCSLLARTHTGPPRCFGILVSLTYPLFGSPGGYRNTSLPMYVPGRRQRDPDSGLGCGRQSRRTGTGNSPHPSCSEKCQCFE